MEQGQGVKHAGGEDLQKEERQENLELAGRPGWESVT